MSATARYIAQDNVSAAERVGRVLVRMAESLNTMPSRGSLLRSRARGRRRVGDSYLVLYRVDKPQGLVSVLRLWHAKQNLEAVPLDWRGP